MRQSICLFADFASSHQHVSACVFLSFHSDTVCAIRENAFSDRLARSLFLPSFTLIFYMKWIQCICSFNFCCYVNFILCMKWIQCICLFIFYQECSSSYSFFNFISNIKWIQSTCWFVFYCTYVVRLATVISTWYCAWNEFNAFAYLFRLLI